MLLVLRIRSLLRLIEFRYLNAEQEKSAAAGEHGWCLHTNKEIP